jgi:phosphatidylglycerol lysyltransferase
MGLAPLSEMNEADLEPRWAKFSNQLFSYDEHFYNFQGVRTQKQQFNPQWEPIYLAAPAGLKLPTVLSNLSEIISGHRRKR